MNDIKVRANSIESKLCEQFNLDADEYMEMWYEWGCQYVERMFRDWSLNGNALNRAVDIYIKSNAFWYFWAKTWIIACERFINNGLTSKKALKLYCLNRPRPSKALHREIVRNSKAIKDLETEKFYKEKVL